MNMSYFICASNVFISWMSAWRPVIRVHCGVALLEIQLSPAGRDWVLLATFLERLSKRDGWDSEEVVLGKLRSPAVFESQVEKRVFAGSIHDSFAGRELSSRISAMIFHFQSLLRLWGHNEKWYMFVFVFHAGIFCQSLCSWFYLEKRVCGLVACFLK